MSKRKRSQADEAAPGLEDGPRKTRVIDTQDSSQDSTKLRAAARQAKSERRSKKKDGQQHQVKPPKPLPEATENLIPDQLPPTDGDHFSSNNDFVSLDDATPTTADVRTGKKKNKSKASTESPSKSTSSQTAQATQQHRFILFIGNLPFSTTTDSINHHFRALQPFTVRHMTDKKTKKSRGTAFIEFESYDKMKTCLKLYHHSLFDPDAHLHAAAEDNQTDSAAKRTKKPSSTAAATDPDPPPPAKDTKPQWQKSKTDKTRRINVELTAGGGGGKSADRRKKIQAKNAKLADERERFQRKEAEERGKKRTDGGGGGGSGGGKGTGANAEAAGIDADRGNVHPSRLRRVKG